MGGAWLIVWCFRLFGLIWEDGSGEERWLRRRDGNGKEKQVVEQVEQVEGGLRLKLRVRLC